MDGYDDLKTNTQINKTLKIQRTNLYFLQLNFLKSIIVEKACDRQFK